MHKKDAYAQERDTHPAADSSKDNAPVSCNSSSPDDASPRPPTRSNNVTCSSNGSTAGPSCSTGCSIISSSATAAVVSTAAVAEPAAPTSSYPGLGPKRDRFYGDPICSTCGDTGHVAEECSTRNCSICWCSGRFIRLQKPVTASEANCWKQQLLNTLQAAVPAYAVAVGSQPHKLACLSRVAPDDLATIMQRDHPTKVLDRVYQHYCGTSSTGCSSSSSTVGNDQQQTSASAESEPQYLPAERTWSLPPSDHWPADVDYQPANADYQPSELSPPPAERPWSLPPSDYQPENEDYQPAEPSPLPATEHSDLVVYQPADDITTLPPPPVLPMRMGSYYGPVPPVPVPMLPVAPVPGYRMMVPIASWNTPFMQYTAFAPQFAPQFAHGFAPQLHPQYAPHFAPQPYSAWPQPPLLHPAAAAESPWPPPAAPPAMWQQQPPRQSLTMRHSRRSSSSVGSSCKDTSMQPAGVSVAAAAAAADSDELSNITSSSISTGKERYRFYGTVVCAACGTTGHLAEDCRVPQCTSCKAWGHGQQECGASYVCKLCGRRHVSVPCSPQQQQQQCTVKRCNDCGLWGHIASSCPRAQCKLCGYFGHKAGQCKACNVVKEYASTAEDCTVITAAPGGDVQAITAAAAVALSQLPPPAAAAAAAPSPLAAAATTTLPLSTPAVNPPPQAASLNSAAEGGESEAARAEAAVTAASEAAGVKAAAAATPPTQAAEPPPLPATPAAQLTLPAAAAAGSLPVQCAVQSAAAARHEYQLQPEPVDSEELENMIAVLIQRMFVAGKSGYALDLLQKQQQGKLHCLARLFAADLDDILARKDSLDLLDAVYNKHSQRQGDSQQKGEHESLSERECDRVHVQLARLSAPDMDKIHVQQQQLELLDAVCKQHIQKLGDEQKQKGWQETASEPQEYQGAHVQHNTSNIAVAGVNILVRRC